MTFPDEIVDRTIRVGGQSLSVAGIGGVATHPEFRRQGFTEILMKTALEQMRQHGFYSMITR